MEKIDFKTKRLKRTKYKLLFLVTIIIIILVIFNNKKINVTFIGYESSKIPNSFNNYSICQISDLHNSKFGNEQNKLIKQIKEINPDIIVITGDLIDSKKYDLKIVLDFIDNISSISPIYYVSGNHEAWSGAYDEIIIELSKRGVYILDNKYKTIEINNESIEILGVIDPAFYSNELPDQTKYILEDINGKINNKRKFKLLLAHRPELFNIYEEADIDLVLSGHAHGGQFRLPFIGGIVAPNQGFFPKYDAGLYTKNKSTMYVSRGLGNSIVPLRINNNPELVHIVLRSSYKKEKKQINYRI